MNISSSGINFSTIPTQVKKLVETIHERTKNWFSSEIISVKNTHISLNEKLDIGKTSPIEIALPDKIKEFFQPKDKNTLNKTLVTVKNITDTNNTCKKNISEEISLPNGIWSSRTQTLQSLSDDQLSTIREQSRASQHNPSPQSYSKVKINGREYSVTYHPQDDLFAVERINGCQGRLVQWLYNMAGHPRGQITWQLTFQLNSPFSLPNPPVTNRSHQATDISRRPGENPDLSHENQPVSGRITPPPVPLKPSALALSAFFSHRQPVSEGTPPPSVAPKPSPLTLSTFLSQRQSVSEGRIPPPVLPKSATGLGVVQSQT